MESIGEVDILIDDGSHVVEHQQISLGFLFQYVKKVVNIGLKIYTHLTEKCGKEKLYMDMICLLKKMNQQLRF